MIDVGVASDRAEAYAAELTSRGVSVERVDDDATGLRVLLADPDRLGRIRSLDGIEWIQSTWAGVDAVDWRRVPPRTVVTGLPGVFGRQMREFVFGHLLAVTQRTDHRSTIWEPTPPGTLAGSRLGILGAGSIGSALAGTAAHFEMEVTGCSLSGRAGHPFGHVYPVEAIDDFVTGLDHLVVVLPATAATEGLVDGRLLELLAPGATLVNVGRGSTVVMADVLAAVRSGRLTRAILDVTDPEPLPSDHPAWHEPEVFITCHTAAISRPPDVVERFLHNLARFERGEGLKGVIDPGRGY